MDRRPTKPEFICSLIGWLVISIPVLPSTVASAESDRSETGTIRFVTMRDRSVLKIDFTSAGPVNWDPNSPPIDLREIDELVLSEEAAGAKIRQIRSLAEQLHSPEFFEREKATLELIDASTGFAALLEELRNSESNPEVKFRLNVVLSRLKSSANVKSSGFDLVVTKSGRRFTGDVGDWSADVTYRGMKLELSRRNISRVSTQPPKFFSVTGFEALHPDELFKSIRRDEDAQLPEEIQRIDFETDPAGNALKIGDDISKRFTDAGFQISTSIPDAIVSVNDFVVQGRSKGLSAATHSPLWEGTLSVKFHAAGNREIPAFVNSAGFWVASVSPGGTALEAYDGSGKLVGKVVTESSGHEFLAFRSSVPIAEIRVVPDPDIDRNYTIDDLFFTKPIPLNVIPERGWATIHTRSGERLLSRRLTRKDGKMLMEELSYGGSNARLEISEIWTFAPADWELRELPALPTDRHWVMLRNGSRLSATRLRGGHRLSTFEEVPDLKIEQVAALWGLSTQLVRPPEDKADVFEAPGSAVVQTKLNSWVGIKDVALGKDWVETPERLTIRPVYHSSPVIWFSPPPSVDPSLGRVILKTGEILFVSEPSDEAPVASLIGIDSESVHLQILGEQVSIPMKFVSSCQFPGGRPQN